MFHKKRRFSDEVRLLHDFYARSRFQVLIKKYENLKFDSLSPLEHF